MAKRGDMELTLYGGGNRRAQAVWLRRLADVLDREAAADGEPDLDPVEGFDVDKREW